MARYSQEERPVILNSNGPAVVRWISNGKPLSLGLQPSCKVHFHLHFDAASKKAFFKLRIPLTLESLFDTPTPLFVFVYPERVESLARTEDVTSDVSSKDLFKNRQATAGTLCHLRFTLSRPADLILPKAVTSKAFYDAALHAQAVREKGTEQQAVHSNASTHVASLLTLLARANALDILVHLSNPKEGTIVDAISCICEAVSSHSLSTNTTSGDLVSLYGGKGGQVLEILDVTPDESSYNEAPPAYDEPASLNEVSNAGESSSSAFKKRRRSTSPDSSLSEKHRLSIEDLFSRLFEGAVLAMESRLESRMQNWLEARLKQQAEEMRNVEISLKDWLDERLRQQTDKIETLADEQDHMWNHFDDEIQQVRNETDELCDVRIDDQMLSVKIECEEYVKDEIKEAKKGIVQHFRSMANLFSDIDSELGDNG